MGQHAAGRNSVLAFGLLLLTFVINSAGTIELFSGARVPMARLEKIGWPRGIDRGP